MRGRGRGKGGVISTDLLACFPSRGHLALMPKPVCSPSRAAGSAPPKRQLPAPLSRLSSAAGRGVSSNPRLLRSRTARRKALPAPPPSASTEIVSEPTSPKVTCAGQIKVGRQCRLHKSGGSGRQARWRRPNWLGALGIKREIVHLLAGAVRGLRLNSSCFGRRIPCNADCTSDEDDYDEEEEEDEEADGSAQVEEEKEAVEEAATNPTGAALSRWFTAHEGPKARTVPFSATDDDEGDESPRSLDPAVPPPNALLLMRCRSAPARGRFHDVDGEHEEDDKTPERTAAAVARGVGKTHTTEAGCDNDLEKLVLRAYAPDVFKVLSTEVVKETWVAGTGGPDGPDPLLLRCRSWRR